MGEPVSIDRRKMQARLFAAHILNVLGDLIGERLHEAHAALFQAAYDTEARITTATGRKIAKDRRKLKRQLRRPPRRLSGGW